MNTTLIRMHQLREALGLSTRTVYSLIANGMLPKPIKVGRSSTWILGEIEDLIAARAGGAPDDVIRGMILDFADLRSAALRRTLKRLERRDEPLQDPLMVEPSSQGSCDAALQKR